MFERFGTITSVGVTILNTMKNGWWKILGAVIFTGVLIVGLTTPLRPGIVESSPRVAETGQSVDVKIKAYNSFFADALGLKAWLKISDDHVISAAAIDVISNRDIIATFDIPNTFSSKKAKEKSTLILNSEVDGNIILPNALVIRSQDGGTSQNQWTPFDIDKLHKVDNFRFPYRSTLNETIRNTFFHVAIWFAMFILLIISLIYSIRFLISKDHTLDIKASAFTSVAIVFGLIGIATGSVWAKFTWGAYWTSDVKLNMSAIAILIYLAYWILRTSIKDIDSRARLSAVYNIFAFAMLIPLIFIIPRLTDSLHPGNGGNPALGGEDLDNTLRMIFYPSIIALTLIGIWISNITYRLEIVKEKVMGLY